jgi:signal peptidase II
MRVLSRLLPAFVVALALDGLSKYWVEHTLELHQPVPILGEFFRLTLGYNTGVAFGLFANVGSWPVLVIGLVIVGMVFWLTKALRAGELPLMAAWPIGFLLGGAVANFVDRLPDGHVTDFLDVGIGATRWPTFNLADSFIVVSLGVLLLLSLQGNDDKVEDAGETDHSLPEGERP